MAMLPYTVVPYCIYCSVYFNPSLELMCLPQLHISLIIKVPKEKKQTKNIHQMH